MLLSARRTGVLTLETMVERDDAVKEAVEELLTFAVTLKTNERSRRIELECRMCGQRDENHTPSCPVPALEEWLNQAR